MCVFFVSVVFYSLQCNFFSVGVFLQCESCVRVNLQ